jgi:hypothetical protein
MTEQGRVEWVHEGRTHRAHEPGEVAEPRPERRFFASAGMRFQWPGERWWFYRSFTAYGAVPEDALRKLWVLISRRLEGLP